MVKFTVYTMEEKRELTELIISGVVGCVMNYGLPPKYFVYFPSNRKVREVSPYVYNYSFPDSEEVLFGEFKQMAGVSVDEPVVL